MSTEKDEQAAAAAAEVRVQPAELDGTALDLAVGGATLSSAPVIGGTSGREEQRKGSLVGNENKYKGTIIPGTENSNPG